MLGTRSSNVSQQCLAPHLPGTQSVFIEPMNESNGWVLPSPAQSVDLSEPQAPGVCGGHPHHPIHPMTPQSPAPGSSHSPPPHSRSWRLTSRLRKGPGREAAAGEGDDGGKAEKNWGKICYSWKIRRQAELSRWPVSPQGCRGVGPRVGWVPLCIAHPPPACPTS